MKRDRVIALGFFDGVHLGHGALLRKARHRADQLGLSACALTFAAHPDQVLRGEPVSLLSSVEDRTTLMTGLYDIEEVLVSPFDKAVASMDWELFVEDILIRQYRARHVVCGHDFRFGSRGAGTPERLREKCADLGLGCDVIAPVQVDGVTVSSTLIRTLLQGGRTEEANRLLGHPHQLTGQVIHGKGLGRQLGFPTANLPIPEELLIPAHGVYASKVRLPDGRDIPAVTNVGVRPTFHDHLGTMAEAWLLDFEEDLYGKTVTVSFYTRLREERSFSDVSALKQTVMENAEETRRYFSL